MGGAGRGKVERSCETKPVPFTTAVQYWFRKGAHSPWGLCPPAAELHLIREQDTPLERLSSPAKMMQGPRASPTVCTTKTPPTPSREVIPTKVPAGTHFPQLGYDTGWTPSIQMIYHESVVCLFPVLLLCIFSTFSVP